MSVQTVTEAVADFAKLTAVEQQRVVQAYEAGYARAAAEIPRQQRGAGTERLVGVLVLGAAIGAGVAFWLARGL